MTASTARGRARCIATGLAVAALYGILLIPEPAPPPPPPAPATERRFQWNQNELWLALEQRFRDAGALGCGRVLELIDAGLRRGDRLLAEVAARRVGPEARILDSIEDNTFQLAPLVGVCLERLPEYVRLVTQTRSVVKRQSEHCIGTVYAGSLRSA